jgi:type II secretory pathway pseudopilin PulG
MRGAMNNAFRRRIRGFSMIEAVAAVALVGVGVTSAMAGLAAMAKTDRELLERETMQRLAIQKYDEIVATNQIDSAELSGDFSDQNLEDLEWAATVEPSGEENLEILTVTVNETGDLEGPQAEVDGLVYRAPIEGGAE